MVEDAGIEMLDDERTADNGRHLVCIRRLLTIYPVLSNVSKWRNPA
jgi:hypothetical protein